MPALISNTFQSDTGFFEDRAAGGARGAACAGDRLHAGGEAARAGAVREERLPRRQDVPAVGAEPYPAACELRGHDPAHLRVLDRDPAGDARAVRARLVDDAVDPQRRGLHCQRLSGRVRARAGRARALASTSSSSCWWWSSASSTRWWCSSSRTWRRTCRRRRLRAGHPSRDARQREYIMRVLVRITWAGALFLGLCRGDAVLRDELVQHRRR